MCSRFICLIFLVFANSLFAGECRDSLKGLLDDYEKMAIEADEILEGLTEVRYLTESQLLIDKIEKVEAQLEDRLLDGYSRFDRAVTKSMPIDIVESKLAPIEEAVWFSAGLVRFMQQIQKERGIIVTQMRELKKRALKLNKKNLPVLCELAQELMNFHFQHIDHSLLSLLDEWEIYLKRNLDVVTADTLTTFKHKLDGLSTKSLETLDKLTARFDAMAKRELSSGQDLNRIEQHHNFIKEREHLPLDIKIKAIEFLLDLARSADRMVLKDLGHDKVSTFKTVKKNSKIPNHIQFWHYHLKRGSKDHVMIWAINKHDERQTYYPLWVGAHGKAPYEHDAYFTSWMLGKLPYLNHK